MSNSMPFNLCIAAVMGFLAGMGTGGGSLLILWLTAVLRMPAISARTLTLLFYLPCALTATIFRWKKGVLSVKKLLPAIAAGTAAAALCAGIRPHPALLQKFFSVFLLTAGLREIFYRPRNAR